MHTLPALLKSHRKRSNLTQKQLAERINFHHTVVSRAENPRSGYIPTRAFLDTFCAVLALSDEEIQQIQAAYAKLLAQRDQPAFPDGATTARAEVQTSRSLGGLLTEKHIRAWAAAGLVGLSLLLALSPLRAALERHRFDLIPVGAVVYQEDFTNFDEEEWEMLNFGKWEVRNVDGNNVFGVFAPDPKAIPTTFLTQSQHWENYTVTADVQFASGVYEQIYFVVRNAGRENICTGYRIGGNRLGLAIFRFDPKDRCQGETLAENLDYPLTEGRVYPIRIEVEGSDIRFYIDNVLLLTAQDDRYPTGGLGLQAYEVEWAGFDNIRVEKR